MSVSSARRWLLEIFGRKRDGRFLGVCNPGTAARGLFGDLGLLCAHTAVVEVRGGFKTAPRYFGRRLERGGLRRPEAQRRRL